MQERCKRRELYCIGDEVMQSGEKSKMIRQGTRRLSVGEVQNIPRIPKPLRRCSLRAHRAAILPNQSTIATLSTCYGQQARNWVIAIYRKRQRDEDARAYPTDQPTLVRHCGAH